MNLAAQAGLRSSREADDGFELVVAALADPQVPHAAVFEIFGPVGREDVSAALRALDDWPRVNKGTHFPGYWFHDASSVLFVFI
jgi:hypothetical protein